MARSRKKTPIYKGNSHRWDKRRSSRLYRRFVQQLITIAEYDKIHNRYDIFHSLWDWYPDYIFYFGNTTDLDLLKLYRK